MKIIGEKKHFPKRVSQCRKKTEWQPFGIFQNPFRRNAKQQTIEGGPFGENFVFFRKKSLIMPKKTERGLFSLSRFGMLLRLFTGVILRVVVVVLFLIGVEVAFSGMFSDSESVSSVTVMMVCFLTGGAISFSISFWFSARFL